MPASSHFGRPAEIDLFDRLHRASGRHRARRACSSDFLVDLEDAEVHREGDLPVLDRLVVGRQRQLRAQCRDVERARPAHDVLQDDRIRDIAGKRPGMTVEVEIEGRIIGIAAIGRLVADETAGRGRDADRAADVGPGRDATTCRRPARPPCRRTIRPACSFGFHGLRVTPHSLRPREAGAGELGRRGPGMDDAARLQDPLVHRRGMLADIVLQDERALARCGLPSM